MKQPDWLNKIIWTDTKSLTIGVSSGEINDLSAEERFALSMYIREELEKQSTMFTQVSIHSVKTDPWINVCLYMHPKAAMNISVSEAKYKVVGVVSDWLQNKKLPTSIHEGNRE